MNWKQRLKEMKLNHMKGTKPDFYTLSGGDRMKVKGYSDSTANGLTAAIVDWINFSNGSATRISSQGQARIINGRATWTHGSTRKGVADVHAIYKGRHLSIGVKIGKDRMSEHQHRERERIERAGGVYYVARDMLSFVKWFEGEFSESIKKGGLTESDI